MVGTEIEKLLIRSAIFPRLLHIYMVRLRQVKPLRLEEILLILIYNSYFPIF